MSSLADLPELVGFFSYSREDDADSQGELSALRSRIQGELRGQLGRTAKTFRLWQDKEAIPSGTLWESEIKNSVNQAVFFIPIVTPTVVASPYCRFELEAFIARETALGRSDLVFPILYIEVPALEDSVRRQNDAVLSLIAQRQYIDWREFRHLDHNSTEVKRAVERFCQHIRDALSKPWLSPEERKQQEEAAALLRAEAERQRQAAEAEAEQRRKDAAEAKEREEEEARRRQSQAQDRQRAEGERRAHEDAEKRRADQERAFAAAKVADTVPALDQFLAAHGESDFAVEAKSLRTTLLEREEAYGGAMRSADPAVLKAFLNRYSTGKPTDKVRRRLGRLEKAHPLRPSRRWLIAALPIAALLAAPIWFSHGPRYDGYYKERSGGEALRFYRGGTVAYGGVTLLGNNPPFTSTYTTGLFDNSIKFNIAVGSTTVYWTGTIRHDSLSLTKSLYSDFSVPHTQEYDFFEHTFP